MKKILALILILMLSFTAFAAEKPQAVSRGGTIVVRIPWEWINSAEMGGTWWGGIYHDENETLAEVLFGVVPPSKVAELILGGDVEDKMIRTFGFNGIDSQALKMSSRPLDDSWYLVARPEGKIGKTWKMYSTVMEYSLDIKNGEVSGNLEAEKLDQSPISVAVTSKNSMKTAWKGSFDGFGMELFHVDGVYIAVITEKKARAETLDSTQLYIDMNGLYDYKETFIDLDGYIDGKTGVYCTVLSKEEADLVMNGAALRLEHDPTKW